MVKPMLGAEPVRFARASVDGAVGDLLDLAEAPVLDLSPERQLDGEAVTWAPRLVDEPDDAVFATVVSVLRCVVEDDLDSYARRLASLMEENRGRLLFAEPTRTAGAVGGLGRMARPVIERSADLHLHDGFRLALWRAGLSVVEVRRYEMPRRAWPVTSMAVGVARHTPSGARRADC